MSAIFAGQRFVVLLCIAQEFSTAESHTKLQALSIVKLYLYSTELNVNYISWPINCYFCIYIVQFDRNKENIVTDT